MVTVSNPLLLVLLIPSVALASYAWYGGHDNLSTGRRGLALAIRLVLLTAVILGLSGLALRLPRSRQAVVFVADLSSSDLRDESGMKGFIEDSLAQRQGDNAVGIVTVGRDSVVEQPVTSLTTFDGFQTSVDPSSTNLERGMDLAEAIIPDGYRRRVVVMSDGQENAGDAVLAARLLHARGVRVDVMPEHVASGADVRVDAVNLPHELRPDERFSLTVDLRSTLQSTTRLDVYRDRALVLSRTVSIRAGLNHLVFPQSPLQRGFHSYRVQITPQVDRQPANNVGSAFTVVGGPPRVLVISTSPAEAANVLESLSASGLAADLKRPAEVIPTLTFLQQYASTVIVDTPVEALGPALTQQFVPYVRDLGHGLLVIGGQQAYGLGGYGNTPLEKALPVTMELPKRPDLPPVGVVLIVESLESNIPINISKQAAKGVVHLLTESDQVAVNDAPDSGGGGWVIRMRPARDKTAIDAAIDGMQPGDPDSYVPALQHAYDALIKSPTRLRHIILLGDGDAVDREYQRLVTSMHRHGVTVSTVVTNAQDGSDFRTMRNIAHWGGGRYYVANRATSIPRIFLREARTVVRSGIVQGRFTPRPVSHNPMLRDLHPLPALDGYVATTPRDRAETVLVSQKLDPLLAAWQFGLGRSVAWTSDAAGLWTRSFVRSPEANRFWSDLVAWTLPASQSSQLYVSTSSAGGNGQVSVEVPQSLGSNPSVRARVAGPGLRGLTLQLQPASPGHYVAEFPASAEGSYFVTVEAEGRGHAQVGQGGLDVPYPDEYRTTGTNMGFLRSIARAGGGTLLSSARGVWADNVPAVYDSRPLRDFLWMLALLLLPVDIAIRRLIVTRTDLEAVWAAVRPKHAEPDGVSSRQSARVSTE